jgi:Ribonuclease G/E
LKTGNFLKYIFPEKKWIIGSIYKGRCDQLSWRELQAAFIDIGLEKNAFLCLEDAISNVSHG